MVAEGNRDWCDDCGQYDEECAGCRAAMRDLEDCMRERQETRCVCDTRLARGWCTVMLKALCKSLTC